MKETIIGKVENKEKLSDIALKSNRFVQKIDFFKFLNKEAVNYSEKKLKEFKFLDLLLIEEFRFLEEIKEMKNSLLERNKSAEFFPDDLEIKEDIESIANLVSEKEEELKKRIDNQAEEVIPNISEILGVNLACKLLAHAGSLEKLARRSSSTIQILGAEKALFRYLKGKGTAPKHGIIFMHPYVSGIKKELRGQVARLIANKVSIAAKIDLYHGDFMGDSLLKEVKEKYKELSEE